MRRTFAAVLATLALLAVVAAAMAQDTRGSFPEWGVTLAVGSDEGSLLIRHDEEIRLIAVDSSTAIRDLYGTPVSLERIQPGERVEYRAESWAGMLLARALRVTSTTANGAVSGFGHRRTT